MEARGVAGCAATSVMGYLRSIAWASPRLRLARTGLRPPQPVGSWDDVRDALRFGRKPPQIAFPPGIANRIPEVVRSGEDCLTLNIWTPDLADAKFPVMLWIPGGMFGFEATGTMPFYDGSRFVRDGVAPGLMRKPCQEIRP
jgi:carboxylesterase 2/para-nitrobenzyl esterase